MVTGYGGQEAMRLCQSLQTMPSGLGRATLRANFAAQNATLDFAVLAALLPPRKRLSGLSNMRDLKNEISLTDAVSVLSPEEKPQGNSQPPVAISALNDAQNIPPTNKSSNISVFLSARRHCLRMSFLKRHAPNPPPRKITSPGKALPVPGNLLIFRGSSVCIVLGL